MARKSGGLEGEYHVVAVRLRINGSGNLKMSLTDLDDQQTQNLIPLAMQSVTRFEPIRLANFQSQRVRLVGKTTEEGESFIIGRIILYVKPVAAEYPNIV